MADDDDNEFFEVQKQQIDERMSIFRALYPVIASLDDAMTIARESMCALLMVNNECMLQSDLVRVMLHPDVTSATAGCVIWSDTVRSTRGQRGQLSALANELLAVMDQQDQFQRAVCVFLDLRPGLGRIVDVCGVRETSRVLAAAQTLLPTPTNAPCSVSITEQTTAVDVCNIILSLMACNTAGLDQLLCNRVSLRPEILAALGDVTFHVQTLMLVACGLNDDTLEQLQRLTLTATVLSVSGNALLQSPNFVVLLGMYLVDLDMTDTEFAPCAYELLGSALPKSVRVLRLSEPRNDDAFCACFKMIVHLNENRRGIRLHVKGKNLYCTLCKAKLENMILFKADVW